MRHQVKEVHKNVGGGGGAVYGLGLLESLVYYLSNSNSFMEIILGIVKVILWPAFLIFKVYQNLGM